MQILVAICVFAIILFFLVSLFRISFYYWWIKVLIQAVLLLDPLYILVLIADLRLLPWMLLSTGIWLEIYCAGLVVSRALLIRYRPSTQAKLRRSNLAQRLMDGESDLGRIYDYTPMPWRLLLGTRPRNLEGWSRQVAFNLNWYLGEPRNWFHPLWYGVPVMVVMLIALLAQGLVYATSGSIHPGISDTDFVVSWYRFAGEQLTGITGLVVIAFHHMTSRILIDVREFRNYLGEVFGSSPISQRLNQRTR